MWEGGGREAAPYPDFVILNAGRPLFYLWSYITCSIFNERGGTDHDFGTRASL